MARRKTPAATWDEFFKVLSTTANVRWLGSRSSPSAPARHPVAVARTAASCATVPAPGTLVARKRPASAEHAQPHPGDVPGSEVSLRNFLQDRKIQLLFRHNLLEPDVLLLELLQPLRLVQLQPPVLASPPVVGVLGDC